MKEEEVLGTGGGGVCGFSSENRLDDDAKGSPPGMCILVLEGVSCSWEFSACRSDMGGDRSGPSFLLFSFSAPKILSWENRRGPLVGLMSR